MNEALALVKDGGAAVAIIVTVFAFLRFLGEERKERTAVRTEFQGIITNHLEHSNDILQKVCLVMERVYGALDRSEHKQ